MKKCFCLLIVAVLTAHSFAGEKLLKTPPSLKKLEQVLRESLGNIQPEVQFNSDNNWTTLKRLKQALRTSLADIEPDLKFEFDYNGTRLNVKYKTQQFKVHSRNKTGVISRKAHDKIGPSYRGFVLFCQIESVGAVHSAWLPQTFTRPYWKTDGSITPIGGTGKQIHSSLSYGTRTDKKIKLLIKQTIQSMSNHKTPKSKSTLIWQDTKTGETIFTADDIVKFDWKKQKIFLTLEGALNFMKFCGPQSGQYREFVIKDGSQKIIEARWVSWASSMGFQGPIYNQSGRLINITSDYPAPRNKETRFSDKLRLALKREGVLGSIDEKKKTELFKLHTIHHHPNLWKESKNGIKARVEFYPQTFRKNVNARAHIYFARVSEEQMAKIDGLEIAVLFTAADGKFHNYMSTHYLPAKIIREGIYVFEFNPYGHSLDSELFEYFGKGKVKATVFFYKNNNAKDARTTYSTVDKITFPEVKIPVKTK